MADDIESSLDDLLENILKELEIDVEDEDGQRVYTTVKLFREDIEGLL